MLLEAARRTPGMMTEPAPFVLQRQLGDFAVVYQLNVYKSDAEALVHAYPRFTRTSSTSSTSTACRS